MGNSGKGLNGYIAMTSTPNAPTASSPAQTSASALPPPPPPPPSPSASEVDNSLHFREQRLKQREEELNAKELALYQRQQEVFLQIWREKQQFRYPLA